MAPHGAGEISALASLASGELHELQRLEQESKARYAESLHPRLSPPPPAPLPHGATLLPPPMAYAKPVVPGAMPNRTDYVQRRYDAAEERYAAHPVYDHGWAHGDHPPAPYAPPYDEVRGSRYEYAAAPHAPGYDRYRDMRYERKAYYPSVSTSYRYASNPGSREVSPGPPTRAWDDGVHDAEWPPAHEDARGAAHPLRHPVRSTYVTPSDSPVLGPLRNMSLFATAPNSPMSSRPGSPTHGRSASGHGAAHSELSRVHSHGALAPLATEGPTHAPGSGHHGAVRYRAHPYGVSEALSNRSRSHYHYSPLNTSVLPTSTSGERSTAPEAHDEGAPQSKPPSPTSMPPWAARAHRSRFDAHASPARQPLPYALASRSAPTSAANSPPGSPLMSPRLAPMQAPSAMTRRELPSFRGRAPHRTVSMTPSHVTDSDAHEASTHLSHMRGTLPEAGAGAGPTQEAAPPMPAVSDAKEATT